MRISNKVLVVIAVICSILVIAEWSVTAYDRYKLDMIINGSATVGIIGAADGPTAIFVSTNYNWPVLALFILLHITLIISVALLVMRRLRRDSGE